MNNTNFPFGDSSLRTFTKKRYRYVGKEKDLESGLYYYGARYYLPWTCRFISTDPLAAQYAQLTPYNYADNNPVNDFDIDGMQDNNSGSSEGSKAGDIPGQNTDAQGNSIPWQDGDIWEDKATGIKYATYNGQWGATTDPVNITPQERNSPVVIESDKYYRPTANGYIESGLVYSDAIKGSDLIQKMNEWQVEAEKHAELSAMERYAKYEAAARKQAVYAYNVSRHPIGLMYLMSLDPLVQTYKKVQNGNYAAASVDIAIMLVYRGLSKAVKGGTNVVYQGIDKATGAVKYVGITQRAPAVRFGEHLNSGTAKSFLRYEVVPGATNMSRIDARIMEQQLINKHGLNNLLNKRNSIAPKYWKQYGIK